MAQRLRNPSRFQKQSKDMHDGHILLYACFTCTSRLEVLPVGEDSTLFARHNRLLLAETVKAKPNRASVAELMKLSYEIRKNEVVSNPHSLGVLLNECPFLQDSDEVRKIIWLCRRIFLSIAGTCT